MQSLAKTMLFFLPDRSSIRRHRIESSIPMIMGDVVRDYRLTSQVEALWPYSPLLKPENIENIPNSIKLLWQNRQILQKRKRFGKIVETIPHFKWYEHRELYREKLEYPLSIAFAFVATHNHFVLDRGGKVFNRSAPVIKLPEGATEDQHLELLGVLNSSTACFWLKQVSHNKGSGVDSKKTLDRLQSLGKTSMNSLVRSFRSFRFLVLCRWSVLGSWMLSLSSFPCWSRQRWWRLARRPVLG